MKRKGLQPERSGQMASTQETELYFCYGCMGQLQAGQYICPSCGYDNRSPHNAADTLPEGTVLAGKYLIGKTLGRGGFGVTYLGYDLMLENRVAIKEFFPSGMCTRSYPVRTVIPTPAPDGMDGYTKGRAAFRQEALNLSRFTSPHIVQVRDFLLENGTAYIVMNFIQGNDLSKEIRISGGRLPWQRVLSLFGPLLPELGHLHEKELIHRDIKPPNLKVVPGGNGRTEDLVLLDFGSARRYVSENVTKTYTAMVTPGFAPAEQYSSKGRQGPYTDVYGICATMYCAITGEVPPSATDLVIGDAELKPISSFGLNVPESVEKAILRGMSIKSADRQQSMRELSEELSIGSEFSEKEPEKAGQLRNELESLKQMIYSDALFAMAADSTEGYEEALQLLKYVPGYSNTDEMTTRCKTRIAELKKSENFRKTQSKIPEIKPEPVPQNTPVQAKPILDKSLFRPGNTVIFGRYRQNSDRKTDLAPIDWMVLEVEAKRALLISKYGLDTIPYHEKFESVTWDSCSLRKWLNRTFLHDAFSEEEQKKILLVKNINPNNNACNTIGGLDTQDRIFLLDIEEVQKYFPKKESRCCEATPYVSKKNGLGLYTSGRKTSWWLRSPGYNSTFAAVISNNGVIQNNNQVNFQSLSVRPAFWISL